MKNLKLVSLSVTVLFLTLLALAGCGVPQTDYDALLAQKTALEVEKQTLQTDVNSVQTEKQTLKENYDRLNDEYKTLQAETDTLQNQYNAANTELENIKEVYPVRDFNSKTELENWLAQNTVFKTTANDTAEDWLGRALKVQAEALQDGYIINVDYDYNSSDETYTVFCTTVIDGFFWFWDPDIEDIAQDTTLMAVE
jgi:hypothetical protein